MAYTRTHSVTLIAVIAGRLSDYAQLVKVRLTSLVVFSALMGYLFGVGTTYMVNWLTLLALLGGGFLITGASNTLNQIIEREYDRLMNRTSGRPLPAGRLSVHEAGLVALLTGSTGAALLLWIHPICALLGVLALVLYGFAYTPLKRTSAIAVFVGAIPGALPAVIGWVAATGTILTIEPWLFFAIQFVWQFPHTWAIAWLLHKDYQKAGFRMLPRTGISRTTAYVLFFYTLLLIPISLLPAKFGVTGVYSSAVILIAGLAFLYPALQLCRKRSTQAALQVMLGSFLYLPVVQLALVLDKLL